MKEQLKKKHTELRKKMKKYDDTIFELLKQGHKKLVVQVIKDYLSQHE